MHFEFVGTVSLDLVHQLQWLIYSGRLQAFVSGDENRAFAIPVERPTEVVQLESMCPHDPLVMNLHPCNLPIPADVYDEFTRQPWCGFRFLDAAACELAVDDEGQPVGDLLRTLVFGPDYGQYVLHPASGLTRLMPPQPSAFSFQSAPRGSCAESLRW